MLLIVSALLLAGVAVAQSTNATCDPSFDWSFNSHKQSPCLVAAYLGSVCSPEGSFIVPALQDGGQYAVPTISQANPCACSSVYYSLLGACAECQVENPPTQIVAWSVWSKSCSMTYLQIFNQNIPGTTAVPHWAYQNVSAQTDDKFNATLAQLQVNGPESTSNPQPTTTSLPSVSALASGKKSHHAGAIAGGVVGGVVLVAFIGIAAFWFIRRRQKGGAPSIKIVGDRTPGEITPFRSTAQTPKLYDPSDPSTFPPSLAPGRVQQQNPANSGNTLSLEQPHVQYTGAPQV